MVHWEYQPAKFAEGSLPVAPHIFKFNDVYYLSGNSAPLYRSKNVLGPYEVAGPWTMANGEPFSGVSNGRRWTGSFDVAMFVDDDNKPYLYYAGRSTDGIYVVPLEPDAPYKFRAEPTHLFGYNADHVWERYGDRNEYIADSWIEGPWVIKATERIICSTAPLAPSGSLTRPASTPVAVRLARSNTCPRTRSCEDDRPGDRHRAWKRRAGAGRELVAVLYHRLSQSARWSTDRHGSSRL